MHAKFVSHYNRLSQNQSKKKKKIIILSILLENYRIVKII